MPNSGSQSYLTQDATDGASASSSTQSPVAISHTLTLHLLAGKTSGHVLLVNQRLPSPSLETVQAVLVQALSSFGSQDGNTQTSPQFQKPRQLRGGPQYKEGTRCQEVPVAIGIVILWCDSNWSSFLTCRCGFL